MVLQRPLTWWLAHSPKPSSREKQRGRQRHARRDRRDGREGVQPAHLHECIREDRDVLTASATAPSTCTTASAQPVVRATVTTAPTRDGTQLRHIAVTKRNDAILTVRGPYLIVHLRIVRHHVRRQSAGERNLAAADHLNRWPHCSQRMLSHPPCFSIGSQQAGQRRSDDLAHRSVVASRT